MPKLGILVILSILASALLGPAAPASARRPLQEAAIQFATGFIELDGCRHENGFDYYVGSLYSGECDNRGNLTGNVDCFYFPDGSMSMLICEGSDCGLAHFFTNGSDQWTMHIGQAGHTFSTQAWKCGYGGDG